MFEEKILQAEKKIREFKKKRKRQNQSCNNKKLNKKKEEQCYLGF